MGLAAVTVGLCGCREAAKPAAKAALRWETRKFERSLDGCGDQSKRAEPCVTFRVEWPEAVAGAPKEVLERMNSAIRERLQPAEAPKGLEAEAAQVMADYEEFRGQFPRASVNYFTRRLAEVGLAREKMVSVELRTEEYRGGAEAETRREWINLDAATGQRVELGDLLRGGARERLGRMVEERTGVAEVELERAWGARETGLVFGVEGAVVTVGWKELNGLLRGDGGLGQGSR